MRCTAVFYANMPLGIYTKRIDLDILCNANMPYCKYCNQPISKFDTDICPNCGGVSPIDPNYETMDITKRFDHFSGGPLYRSKSQKVAAILSMTWGFFGLHEFYIKRPKIGLVILIITLVLVGGLGSILAFAAHMHPALAYLIPFGADWLFFIVYGILFLKKDSPKDGEGEFLR